MLTRLLRAGPRLSSGVRYVLIAFVALAYVALYAAGSAVLPESVFRDAGKIQAQMSGANTYDGSSFDTIARFYALFGPLLNVFVLFVGLVFIWQTLKRADRPIAFVLVLVLCMPCLMFNLFVASKDTVVVALSLAIVALAQTRLRGRVFLIAVALYAIYGVLVRQYFLLIVVAASAIRLYRRAGLRWKIALLTAMVLALLLLPSAAYMALMHPRDLAVDYLNYGSEFGARTGFYNPLTPDSFSAFVADYLYATLRLNLPLLFSPDLKGAAMQWFIVLALWSALRGTVAHSTHREVRTLSCLVLAHVLVSMLFEPDLGSYIRHLSSVSLFCAVLMFEPRAVVHRS